MVFNLVKTKKLYYFKIIREKQFFFFLFSENRDKNIKHKTVHTTRLVRIYFLIIYLTIMILMIKLPTIPKHIRLLFVETQRVIYLLEL